MKKYFIIYILLLFVADGLHAQATGYLGKKGWVSFSLPFGPQFPYNSSENDEIPGVRLYLRPEISASYLVSDHIDLGVSLKRSSVRAYNKTLYVLDQNYLDYTNDISVRSFSYSLFLEFYNKGSFGSLPPLGKFYRFELCFTKGRPVYLEPTGPLTSDIVFSMEDLPGLQDISFFLPELLYTLGTRTIFYDVLVFDYGAQLGIPLSGKGWRGLVDISSYENVDLESDPDAAKDFITRQMTGYQARSMLMSFHLGIGYLAF